MDGREVHILFIKAAFLSGENAAEAQTIDHRPPSGTGEKEGEVV